MPDRTDRPDLTDGPDGPDAGFPTLSGIDGPRPLPAGFRARLEATLVAEGEALAAGIPRSVDRPRPLPAGVRQRLETTLLDRRAGRAGGFLPRHAGQLQRLVAVAAVLVLLVGLASLRALPRRDAPSDVAVGSAPADAPSTTAPPEASGPLAAPVAGEAEARATGGGSTAAAGPMSSPGANRAAPGPPPPFADPAPAAQRSSAPAAAAEGDSSASSGRDSGQPSRTGRTGSPATGAPLPVSYAAGDAAQVAGFRAYVDLLNETGGIGGRPIRAMASDPNRPDPAALATVNLSSSPLPATTPRPVLETLAVPDAVLRGEVFGFASAADRQAHLIADAVFPTSAAGATATIYTQDGTGVFAGVVPAAIESVLRGRGVTVVRVRYSGGRVAPMRSDAVFLSLDNATVRQWLSGGGADAVDSARGIAGIFSLVDESLAAQLPAGTRAMAPYVYPVGEEAQALRRATQRPLDSALVHGWNTAKVLAVALHRSGADTRAAMPAALRALAGYDSGMAPPYEVRTGTTSRTPEGVLWTSEQQAQIPSGGFRRDPH